jgi:hypothetical protein
LNDKVLKLIIETKSKHDAEFMIRNLIHDNTNFFKDNLDYRECLLSINAAFPSSDWRLRWINLIVHDWMRLYSDYAVYKVEDIMPAIASSFSVDTMG